jgi:hypothetical protein
MSNERLEAGAAKDGDKRHPQIKLQPDTSLFFKIGDLVRCKCYAGVYDGEVKHRCDDGKYIVQFEQGCATIWPENMELLTR